MAGVGALNFGLADLYGSSMGFYQTRQQSIPEADDQDALVDEPEVSARNPHNVDPAKHKSIFVSVGVVLVLIFLMSYRK
jgi:hypothetical protein